jgi:hypothetical protein
LLLLHYGKNKTVKVFIDIPEESNNIITIEEKELYVDLVYTEQQVEVPNDEVQQNSDDALNEEDSESDYVSDDAKEEVIAEQAGSSEEVNIEINAQRIGYPGAAKFRSGNFRQPGSPQ